MSAGRRLRGFLLLSALLLVASAAWALLRHRARADEREAYRAVTAAVRTERDRIDSLEAELVGVRARIEAEKRSLDGMAERIAHLERSANNDRLPTPAYRSYRQTIDRHNDVVARHNALLVEQRETYAAYSTTVDRYNALADSANQLQRAAVQEGYALPADP